jgi:hypothetical protein
VRHGLPSPLSSALFTADFARSGLELMTTLAAAPWLRQAPRGDGHAVLLVPALLVGDSSMTVMHQYLRDLGYATASWQQGLNLGRWETLQPLLATFDRLRATTERGVSLVGWSMGGLYARELARRRPLAVRLLVQLGTPFGVDARTNPNWPVYQLVSGAPVEEAPRHGHATPRPPVPTVSIWSRSDGHVDWRNCVEDTVEPPQGAPVENVEVVSSHFGLRHHPQVLWTIAQRLARASVPAGDAQWRLAQERLHAEPHGG